MMYIFAYERELAMPATTMSDLRANLARYLDRVSEDREPLLVTRQGGKGNVVIVSADEFDSWRETVHLLGQPATAERLRESIRQVRAGRVTERELLHPDDPAA